MAIACTVRECARGRPLVQPGQTPPDPYAKAIAGIIRWSDALFGYTIGHPDADPSRDTRNSADLPKCIVVDPAFSWGDDTRLRTPAQGR